MAPSDFITGNTEVAALAGAELRPLPKNESMLGNRVTVVLAGALSGFGDGFALAVVVVAAYVSLYTDNLVTVGLAPALAFGLWNLGALCSVWLVTNRDRRLPWAFATHLIRAGMMALLAYVAYQENVAASDRLESFLITYGMFSFFSGFASSSTNSLIRGAIDPADRSRVFSRRSFAAALFALLSGLIVRQVFESGNLSMDRSFAFLFIAAAAAMAAATFFVLTVRESPGASPRSAGTPGGTAAYTRSVRSFRRFMVFRILLGCAALADCFLIVFGIRELDMALEFIGVCVLAFAAAMAAGLVVWRAVERANIARSSLQIASLLKVVPPLIAVSIPYLQSSAFYEERTTGNAILHWMIVGAFVTLGLATASIAAGCFGYLISLSAGMATTFTMISNAALAAVSLAGLAAGWIADRWGFDVLFGAALALAVVALLSSGLLPVTAPSKTNTGPGLASPSRQLRPMRLTLR